MIDDGFKFSMEYKGCLIEVAVPESAVPEEYFRKEWLQNTVVDMYARLRFMMASVDHIAEEEENAGE